MKNINNYSKLAILLTILYILTGQFINSDLYFKTDYFLANIIFFVPYLGGMIGAVALGIVGLIRAVKARERGKWAILLLTLFNLGILILSITALVTENGVPSACCWGIS